MSDLFDLDLEIKAIQTLVDVSKTNPARARVYIETDPLPPHCLYNEMHATVLQGVLNAISQGSPAISNLVLPKLDLNERDKIAAHGVLSGQCGLGWGTYPGMAKSLINLADRRKIKAIMSSVLKSVSDSSCPVDQILSDGSQAWSSVAVKPEAALSGETVHARTMQSIQDSVDGMRIPCISTGIDSWDSILGGIEPGTATIIGGQAGVGKSALLATMIRNLTKSGQKIGVFSLEDLGEWIVNRFISDESAVPLFNIAKQPHLLSKDQIFRIQDSESKVRKYMSNLYIDERSYLTASQIEQAARHFIINLKCSVIVLDHLGKIDYEERKLERSDYGIRDALAKFINVAKTYRVPWIIAAHLKNTGEDAKYRAPQLNDFAQSMFIGRDARAAVGLYLDKNDPDALCVNILKQTSGASEVGFVLRRRIASGLVDCQGGRLKTSYSEQEKNMLADWRQSESDSEWQ